MAAPDRTHYDVLGISRDADAASVRSAWKLHVQAWHPDRFSDQLRDEAERQTTRINEAYSTLRDSSRRAAYDCRLAADELAAAPDPAPARRTSVRPTMARAYPGPIAAAAPPEPATTGEQLAAIGHDAMRIVRRHPRMFAAAAAVWLLVFGGSIVLHAASGPTLPRAAASPVATSTPIADDEQVEDLAELAERARAEADKADAELAQLMREDARIAAAEAAAAERAARAAAKAARRRSKGKPAPGAKRRVVRVLPARPR